jgi:hypothetical protein
MVAMELGSNPKGLSIEPPISTQIEALEFWSLLISRRHVRKKSGGCFFMRDRTSSDVS